MNIVFSLSGVTLRGPTQAEDFSYSVVETPLVAAGTTSTQVVKDVSASVFTGGDNTNNFRVAVVDSTLIPGHTFINQAPTVASVDSLGNAAMVTRASAMNAVVDIVTPVGTRRYTRVMNNSGAAPVSTALSFQAGSLGKHIADNLLALVAGKTTSDANMALFSSATYSQTAPAGVRNPSCFTASLDLSGISFVNPSGAANANANPFAFPYHAISPRHVIAANHIFGYSQSGPTVFMRPDGTFQTVNVIDGRAIPGTDIAIGYLDAPLTGVNLFRMLPANWASYLPVMAGQYMVAKLPTLSKGIFTLGLIGTGNQVNINYFQSVANGGLNCPVALPATPAMATDAWYIPVSGGDSSGPAFVIVNGKLVLLTAYFQATNGPDYMNHTADITAAMNSLAAAHSDNAVYAPLYADLSAFTAY